MWGWGDDIVGKALPIQATALELESSELTVSWILSVISVPVTRWEVEAQESLEASGPASLTHTAGNNKRPCLEHGGR